MARPRFPWIYRPGVLDLCEPLTHGCPRGRAIERNARVRGVTRYYGPNMRGWSHTFAVVEDADGNRQTVFRRALQRP